MGGHSMNLRIMLLFYEVDQVMRTIIDFGWEVDGNVARFLKRTHAAPTSSNGPQKQYKK